MAEFHYLHHQPDGRPYDNVAEMSERIVAAADDVGIGLTLLPGALSPERLPRASRRRRRSAASCATATSMRG